MRILKLLPLLFGMMLMTACDNNDDEWELSEIEGLQGHWALERVGYFGNPLEFKRGLIVYLFTSDNKMIVNATIDNPPLFKQGIHNYNYKPGTEKITIDGIEFGFRLDGHQMTIVEPGASYDAGGIFDFVKVKK